jgi:flagellin-like hook-associated protein FlgL
MTHFLKDEDHQAIRHGGRSDCPTTSRKKNVDDMESLSLSHSVVNNLNATLYENTQIQRHLQTGRKIINNYEDSGGLGSLTRLNSTILRNQAVQQNLQGSLSLLQAQDGMLKVIGGVLDRSAELKTKFNSTMYNTHEKAYYDEEFTELQNELRQIAQSKWNGVSLFSTQDSKTLFGQAVDGQTINQESSDDGSGNTLALSRWGIYHLEPPIPPREPFGIDFLAITLSDESHGVYSSNGATGENSYLQDKQNWENYLAQLGIDAKIAVTVNENRTGNPTGPLGGNVVPDSMMDTDVESTGIGKVFRGAGRDDFSLNPPGVPPTSTEQAQFLYDQVFQPMVAEHGIPKAMGIFVDNSGSLNFNNVNQGLLEFVNIVKSNHPEIVLPDENYTTMATTDPEGEDLDRNDGAGFFKGIRLADDENWIEQSQIALQELVANDPAFFAAINAPDGPDPTYELDDYSIEDFEGFMDSLVTARAQNGAEQSRIKHELDELQTKQMGLEQAQERADGLDYSLAMARYSKSRDQLHFTANLVSAAREMENILYTDFLDE